MGVTVAQICDGVKTTLSASDLLKVVLSYSELTEAPPAADLPLVQIMPNDGTCDISNQTDATTFGGIVRQHEITLWVDVIAAQRAHLDRDMGLAVDAIDEMIDLLESERGSTMFVDGVKSFRWSWERAVFLYGNTQYMGARFIIIFRVF